MSNQTWRWNEKARTVKSVKYFWALMEDAMIPIQNINLILIGSAIDKKGSCQ